MLGLLAITLLAMAAIVAAAVALLVAPNALLLVALALVLAAAICWRVGRSITSRIEDSRAWSQLSELSARMTEREALWSSLPAPAAAWDGDGRLLAATQGWRALNLSLERAPDAPELVVGEPARVFVVEPTPLPDGTRFVFLREVTRERNALQAKDELLAVLGHEMRTPLSSIKGYGQLMARQLATVQEQVQRLDHLIAEVLDTAHSETGTLKVQRAPVSIRDMIRSAGERFSAANPQRNLEVHIETDAFIEGDAERLCQVMDNLLSNAAKYSPEESVITLQGRVAEDWVRIAVRDHGRGIAAEHLSRLFERFYRVPDDGSGPGGFGLGLSIVRDLVEAHGGRMEVASDGPGSGSTFTVVLPLTLALQSESTHGLVSQ